MNFISDIKKSGSYILLLISGLFVMQSGTAYAVNHNYINRLLAVPVAENDTYTVNEGATLNVAAPGVITNDTDEDLTDILTAVLVTAPAHATSFTLNSDGSFTYVHDGSETTGDSFTYYVNDGVNNSNTATVTLSVTTVNDAPVLNDPGPATITFTEDGAEVVLYPSISVTDADNLQLTGALVSITAGLQTTEDRLIFTPAGGITGSYNTTAGILTLSGSASPADYTTVLRSVKYNNLSHTPTTASRTVTVTVSDAGPVNAVSNTITKTINVTAVNDAPVLNDPGPSPVSYTENQTGVALFPSIALTDPDNTQVIGAVIDLTTGFQTGQDVLSVTNGSGVTGTYDPLQGTLTLTGTTTLANYQGVIRTVAYSNSSDDPNTAARTVIIHITDAGAENATSNTITKSINITAVNDSPSISDPGPASVTFTEGIAPVLLYPSVTLSDLDHTMLTGATIDITTGLQSAQDVLAATAGYGINVAYNSTDGTLTLTGSSTIANYQTVLRSVTYSNTSQAPNTNARTVIVNVTDGSAQNPVSNTVTKSIQVVAVNDAPVISDPGATTFTYIEDAPAVLLCPSIIIEDVDNTQLAGATVGITSGFRTAEDELTFNTGSTGITGSFNATTGLLTFSGTASLANYQTVLRTTGYINKSQAPVETDRILTITVNDGGSTDPFSNVLNKTVEVVAVNDPPSLAGIEGATLTYTENSTPLVVTSTITVTEVDNLPLSGANVSIGGYVNGQDMLNFTNMSGITGNWNATTGVLMLTGNVSAANYQAALRTITYENSSDNPSVAARTVSFTANDGFSSSNLVSRNITVVAVNDAPVISDPSSSPVSFTENGGAVLLSGTLEITDLDNTTLSSALVTIASGYTTGQDVLSFTAAGGITGSFTNGVLTLNGTTTLANYRTVLRSVRYNNTSEDPATTNRTIQFVVYDAAGTPLISNILSKTVTVTSINDLTLLQGIEGSAASFTEGNEPIQITNTLTVSDVDNTTLNFAIVSISGNYQTGQDFLSFTDGFNIAGNWNAATGNMTLTGPATASEFQSALRTVRFSNTNENPNTGLRTISITANDGGGNSIPATRNIAVANVNDAPVLTETSVTPVPFTENGGSVRLTSTLLISDVDNTNLASATIVISSGYQANQDTLIFTPVPGINGTFNPVNGTLTLSGSSALTNYQTALRSVHYNNHSEAPDIRDRIITFVVNDGSAQFATSNVINKTVTITAVNDAPEARNVIITAANDRIGTLHTGTFTFYDVDGDLPLTHIYRWYRSDYSNGSESVVIAGANSTTYRPLKTDGGKYISFEVTPVDENELAGTPVRSAYRYINANPVATNAHIYAPVTIPGSSINGRFTYADKENNIRGNAIYRWYRSEVINPSPSSPGVQIGVDSTFRLRNSESGKYIWFKVNPVATSGSTPGDSVWSNVIGPIGTFSSYITGTDTFCYGSLMPIRLTITGGRAPYTATFRRSSSVLNKDTIVSNIQASPLTMNVKIPGTYTLIRLVDTDADEASLTDAVPVIVYTNPKSRARIAGSATICRTSTTPVTLNFQAGVSPWRVVVRRRETPVLDTVLTGIEQSPFEINGMVINNAPTRYRVVSITDADGCPGDTASGSIWINPINSPIAQISGRDSICPGETTGLQVALSSGTTPWSFTYIRNGANPVTVSNIANSIYTLQLTQAGVYSLSGVSDLSGSGCYTGSGEIIQYTVPTAQITGNAVICEHESGDLTVNLTGKGNWRYSYQLNGGTPVEMPNISQSTSLVHVRKGGTYTLVEVYDRNCKGTVSGTATVTKIPAPDVTVSGLDPAYLEAIIRVPVYGTPMNGSFIEDPGLIPYNNVMHFWPIVAGLGTHKVIYSYQDPATLCYGYDTVTVRVIKANGSIMFEKERNKYCTNDGPFTVYGANIRNDTGSFTINGGRGLTDHGDNTATIRPRELTEGVYTITYTYLDGTPVPVSSNFEIGRKPVADFKWATECYEQGQPIEFTNTSVSTFGYLTDTSYFWKIYNNSGYDVDSTAQITYTFPGYNNYKMELQIHNTYGCVDTVIRQFPLRRIYKLNEEDYQEDFETKPLTWQSVTSTAGVNSWTLGTPTKGFVMKPGNQSCWYTNIRVSSPPREQSWVTSPCFDFRGFEKPLIKLDIWRQFNANRDGANLQATVDSGKTWTLIGQLGDGIKWYNSFEIFEIPGNSRIGWANIKDADWQYARHALDVLSDKQRVQFRIVYGSDGTAKNTDGFAFDNITIRRRNRMALIEHFTNSSMTDCFSADSTLDDFAEMYKNHVYDIQYHTDDVDGDPFYDHNPVIPTSREFYYGLSDVPYAVIDGGTIADHRVDYDVKPLQRNAVLIESLTDGKFTLKANASVEGNNLYAKVDVTANTTVPLTELSLRIAVVETGIKDVTGNNGDTAFRNVVKAMLPGAAGTTIYKSWQNAETVIIYEHWPIENTFNRNKLAIVAFLQDEGTREVYQVAFDSVGVATGVDKPVPVVVKTGFIVYPNPARSMITIRLNKVASREVTVQLYNNTGRLVYTGAIGSGDESMQLPVEEFPAGLYFLRLFDHRAILGTNKLLISR